MSTTRCSLESMEPRRLLSAPPAAYDYLSNMNPSFARSGFGPIGLDQSNGEEQAGDGGVITLNGARYGKGLGVHADAELHYTLAGQYRSFISDVGIDDESGDGGSAVFQVFADGEKLFDSGVLTGISASKRINVDVTGKNQLVLIVNNGGDDSINDHADFAGARLIRPSAPPPVVATLGDVQLAEGSAFVSTTGAFSDASAGPWFGSVDWGDGSGRRRLTLDEQSKTFSLYHSYDDGLDGDYTVTVRIGNGRATGIQSFHVSVQNVAPSNVGLIGGAELSAYSGVAFKAPGIFSDPGEFGGESYSATIDFGDGTEPQRLPTSGRFFEVEHVYSVPGRYTVTSSVMDEGGKIGSGQNVVVVTDPRWTYLSDLRPASEHRGPGLYNADMSFGQNPMSINGVSYRKGLGVSANSEIVYNLDGKYQTLMSDIGVDDEVGRGGVIQFQVFADSEKIFESGTMRGIHAARAISLDVRNVSELRLVVVHARGGTPTSNDHGNWAGIRLV